jgi:hypothetical protein
MTTAQQTLNGPFSPPPCSAAHIDPLLNEDYGKALTPAPEPPRCRFLSSDKRQCRMLRAGHHPDFCLYHAARQEEIFALLPEREFALAPELEALAADLTTATGVNRALGQVFRLLAQNRITRKDAVAFGYIAQLLLQTVPGVRAEAADPARIGTLSEQHESKGPVPAATPLTLSSRPAAKVYPPAANVYPQDELRGDHKVELSPLNKVSEARLPRSGCTCGGSLSARPIPEKPSPRDTTSANPVDSAAAANASATSAFSRPGYADLLNRSLDLLDGKFDASPESEREARRLMNDLERLTPPRVTTAECVLPQPRSQPAQNVQLENHST